MQNLSNYDVFSKNKVILGHKANHNKYIEFNYVVIRSGHEVITLEISVSNSRETIQIIEY